MSLVAPYLLPIMYIISIIIGTLIIQNLAKNNEWEDSYKVAFIVIFMWETITFGTSIIIELITKDFSFTETQMFASISFYTITFIISLSTFLIIGPLIVKKFYEVEFRESFSMAIRVVIYVGIIQSLFLPLYLI